MVYPRFKALLLLVLAAGAHGVHIDETKHMETIPHAEIFPHEYPLIGGLAGALSGAVVGGLIPGDVKEKILYGSAGAAVAGGAGTAVGVWARGKTNDKNEKKAEGETTEAMLFTSFTSKPWYLQMHNFQDSTGCAKLTYEPLPENETGVWDYSLSVTSENGYNVADARMCLKKGEMKPILMGRCPQEGIIGKQADGRVMFKDMVHAYSERRGYAILTEVKQSGRPYKFFMTRSRQASGALMADMMDIAKAHGLDISDMVQVDFAGCYGNVPPP